MRQVPFRVMCINDKTLSGEPQAAWMIKFGEKYEVVRIMETHWGIAYELNIQPGVGYWPEQFAILPSTTEEIAVESEQEAIIYQR